MSQPLKSSCARRPSSRYTAGEFAPPLWNWTLISCPMPADGTIRYSTGRPGRENAPAVAEPPTTPTSPGSATAARAATAKRRAIFPTKLMLLHIQSVVCRTSDSLRAHVVNHTYVASLISCDCTPGRRSAVEGGDQVGLEGLQLRAPISPRMVPSGWELKGCVGATGRCVFLLKSQVAADGQGFQAVGVERLTGVDVLVGRATARRAVDPQPRAIAHDAVDLQDRVVALPRGIPRWAPH